MKTTFGIFMLFCSLLFVGSSMNSKAETKKHIVVTQVNSKWNWHNNLKLERLKGCKYRYAYLEDQTIRNQEALHMVPVIRVTYDNVFDFVYEGNIMLEPTITVDSLQRVVDSLNSIAWQK